MAGKNMPMLKSCGTSIMDVYWNREVCIGVKAVADGLKDKDKTRQVQLNITVVADMTDISYFVSSSIEASITNIYTLISLDGICTK